MSSPENYKSPEQGLLPPDAEQALRADAKAVLDTAKGEFDKIAEEATGQASDLVDQAKAQIADVTEKAKGLAAEQKDLLAGQIGGVADAMERVAKDLEGSNASSASYARMIADGASRISATVRDNDVEAILSMAQDFGRKQPAAFIGAAALLGFAASRFLLASAEREEQRVAAPQQSAPLDENGTPQIERRPSYGATGGGGYTSDGRL